MGVEKRVYQLMNKDLPVLSQEFEFGYNRSGKKVVMASKLLEQKEELLPFGFTTLEDWANCRICATQRMDVKRLLKILGLNSIFDFIDVFHSVSLTDTFWIRSLDSEENLKWRAISPYTNPLDERIRRYAFNNIWEAKVAASRITAEYSTDGSFAKCWQRDGNQIYLCKCGTSGASNAGLEPYSEYYVNQIEDRLGIQRYVTYTLHTHKERLYTKCPLFTSEQVGLVSVDSLLLESDKEIANYSEVFDFLRSLGVSHLEEDFANMMVLDALTFNVDRHLGNIGVLFDTQTLRLLRLSPIYDNNLALLPYWNERNESISEYFKRHTDNGGKLDIVSKLGTDFITLGKTFLTPVLRTKLWDIITNGFEFEVKGGYNLSSKRLKVLSDLVVKQARHIVSK